MDDMVVDLCGEDDSKSPNSSDKDDMSEKDWCGENDSRSPNGSDKDDMSEEEEVKHSEAAKKLAASHPPDVLQLALYMRYALGLRATSGPADLRRVMSTHHLAGQAVRLQGSDGVVLGRGRLEKHGQECRIACACPHCGGLWRFGLIEFLAHCGSPALAPATALVLEASNRSLQQVVDLVNDPLLAAAAAAADIDLHSDRCHSCGDGGELLCCDGCTAAFHLSCTELSEIPENDWICPLCVSERTGSSRHGVLQALAVPPADQRLAALPAGLPARAVEEPAAQDGGATADHALAPLQSQGMRHSQALALPAAAVAVNGAGERRRRRRKEGQQQRVAKAPKIHLVIKKPQPSEQPMQAAAAGQAVDSGQPAPGLHATPAGTVEHVVAPSVPSMAAGAPPPTGRAASAPAPPQQPPTAPLSTPSAAAAAAAAAAAPPPGSNTLPVAAKAALPAAAQLVSRAGSSPPLPLAAAAMPLSPPAPAALPPAVPASGASAQAPAATDASPSNTLGGKPQSSWLAPVQAKASSSGGRGRVSGEAELGRLPKSLPNGQDTQQQLQQAQSLLQPSDQRSMPQVASPQQPSKLEGPAGPAPTQQQQAEAGGPSTTPTAADAAAPATESRRFMTLLLLLQEAAVPEAELEAFLRHYAQLAPPQRRQTLQQLQLSDAGSMARSLVSEVLRGQPDNSGQAA